MTPEEENELREQLKAAEAGRASAEQAAKAAQDAEKSAQEVQAQLAESLREKNEQVENLRRALLTAEGSVQPALEREAAAKAALRRVFEITREQVG